MIWLRGITVFLGCASFVITFGECMFQVRDARWDEALRWFGRSLLVLCVVAGNLRAISQNRPFTWISALATAGFALTLLGYALSHRPAKHGG